MEIFSQLEEIRRWNSVQEKLITSLLGEIYCMVHTAVSLLRTALLQILGLTNKDTSAQPPAPPVLATFDETSDLTIARSLQDFEKTCAYHQIKNGKFTNGNLYWKSKLRKPDSALQAE